jgi:hypothetical protein
MKDKKKKMTAAIAAVMSYLQEEEAAIQMQAAATQAEAGAPPTVFRPWGIVGRQAQMQMRNMIQLKAFHHRVR